MIRTRVSVGGPLLFEATFDEVGSATMRFETHHVELSDAADGDGYRHGFFYWLADCPSDAFEAAHRRDGDVDDVLGITTGGESLFRTRTRPLPGDRRPVLQRAAERDMTVLTARRTRSKVTVSLLGPSRRALDDLFHDLRAADFDVRVERLLMRDSDFPNSVLTPPQRETLKLAYERGYYEIPRGASLMELAGELGVSDQACSERLRRGVQRLLAEEFD